MKTRRISGRRNVSKGRVGGKDENRTGVIENKKMTKAITGGSEKEMDNTMEG